jgi:hypothetical protein
MKPNDPIRRDARRAQRYSGLPHRPQTSQEAERVRAQRQADARERQRQELRAERLAKIQRQVKGGSTP